MGRAVPERADPHFFNDPLHLLTGFRLRFAQVQHPEGDLLVYTGGKQLVVRILKDDPHPLAQLQQPFSGIIHRGSVKIQGAGGGAVNAVAAQEKSGFSGAVGSHKGDLFSAADLQGEAV